MGCGSSNTAADSSKKKREVEEKARARREEIERQRVAREQEKIEKELIYKEKQRLQDTVIPLMQTDDDVHQHEKENAAAIVIQRLARRMLAKLSAEQANKWMVRQQLFL